VGIALMVSLITAAGVSMSAFAHVGGEFVLQVAVGVVGGRGAAVVHPAGAAAQ
jgi:hypothetical protein